MIVLHHLDHSRSHRILWLLEELGLPYEVVRHQRDAKTLLAPPELLKIHPLGKSPVIVDGDRTVAESGAIIEYILETYGEGRLVPAAPEDRLRYRYWLHYAEGSAMPMMVMKLVFLRFPASAPGWMRPIARGLSQGVQDKLIDPQLRRHVAYWEAELAPTGWFAGAEFSAADIQMSFPVEASQARAPAAGPSPAIEKFLDAIRARPAYRKAIAVGGPVVWSS